MSSNEIETNNMNGPQLAEQGPWSGRCSRQGNIGRHHENPVISKRRKWTSQENKIVMECYLLSVLKHMLSLWQQKGMFWVSEQRLVDLWSNGLVVKMLDCQSRGPLFKTTGWLQGRLSLSSFRGR